MERPKSQYTALFVQNLVLYKPSQMLYRLIDYTDNLTDPILIYFNENNNVPFCLVLLSLKTAVLKRIYRA